MIRLRPVPYVIAVAWLLLITALYLRSSAATLSHRDFLGSGQAIPVLLVIAAIAAIGVPAGLLGLRTSRVYVRAVLGLATAAITAMLALGGAAAGAAVVTWLLALGWSVGDRTLSLLFRRTGDPTGLERATFAIALALGIYSHVTLGAALLGLLDKRLALLLLLLASFLLRRDLQRKARETVQAAARLWRFTPEAGERWFIAPLLALVAAAVLVVLIEAVAPEIQFDSLNYHLALPRIYIEEHRFVTTPYIVQSWFFLGADMNYLLAMLTTDQVAAKLTNFAYMAITAMAIVSLGRCFSPRTVGPMAAALFVTTPLVGWEASTAYVDSAVAMYAFLAIVASHHWMTEGGTPWVVVAGLMAGFAISAKVNVLLMLIPLGLVLVSVAVFRRPSVGRRAHLEVGAFVVGAAVSVAPWPTLRFLETGNPVFPLLNGIFKSPLWPPVNETFNLSMFGIGTTIDSLVRMPWAMTFGPGTFIEAMPTGVLGLGLLGVAILPLIRPVSRPVLALIVILLLFTVAWAFVAQYLRYYLPALPIACVLTALALAALSRSPWNESKRRYLGALPQLFVLIWVLASLPIMLATYWRIPERIPYGVAFGFEGRDDYLTRIVPSYDGYQFLRGRYPSQKLHILSIGDEARLYAPGTLETDQSPTVGRLSQARDPDEVLALLRERGITHLLIDRNARPTLVLADLRAPESFVDRYFRLDYASRNIEIYRLIGEEKRQAPEPMQLMVNNSFEGLVSDRPAGWESHGVPLVDLTGLKSRTGRVAVLVTPNDVLTQAVPVTAGKHYRLSHYSRSEVNGSSVRLQINWTDTQGKLLAVSINVFVASPDWTRNVLTATAPSGAAVALVYANAHVGSVWLDDFSLIELD